jgi:osmoprotectant transport system ATP-binding protein
MPAAPLIELDAAEKRYGGATALAPTTLAVERGRTLAVIGPSGCGKSTLLRLMIGLLSPDGGRVRFDGEVLSPANVLGLRRRMGYVIQDGGLFPHLTAGGNIALAARHHGWDAARIAARIGELAALTQFPTDGLERFPSQLSGGQRQRVGLMRALMLDPDLLLLDEPLGALDPMIRSELQADLQRIFRALGKTVVIVTHDLAEAALLGDELVLLRDGRVLQRGTLAQLAAYPADPFVTRFLKAQRGLP